MKRIAMLSVFLMFAVIVVGQTKPKAAPVKPSGKYAVLQLPAYNDVCGFAETNSTLYINSGDNVFAVDKVTGETKVVLKSEDDTNPFSGKILGIAGDATTLYYYIAGKGLFNSTNSGPIYKSDRVSPRWMELTPDGRHLLLGGPGSHTVCYDLDCGKPQPLWMASAYSGVVSGGKIYIIGTDGMVSFSTLAVDTVKRCTRYRPGTRPERYTDPADYSEIFIAGDTDSYDEFGFLAYDGRGGAIVAMDSLMVSVPGFSKVASTGSSDLKFLRFVCRGTKAFALTGGDWQSRFLEYGASLVDNRTIKKSKNLQTDILEPKAWPGASDRYFNNSYDGEMFIDAKGNLWYADHSKVFVYNADGIQGYRALKGQFMKVE